MYIIDIVPLRHIPRTHPQTLSYFSTKPLSRGALITIPFGKKSIAGIVLKSGSLRTRKIELKKARTFQLKNIQDTLITHAVPEHFLSLTQWLSNYFITPFSITTKHALPSFFLVKKYHDQISSLSPIKKPKPQTLILVPEISYIESLIKTQKLKNPVILHSKLSNQEQFTAWKTIAEGTATHIIGTRSALFFPFINLKEIIIEDYPNDAYYTENKSPYYFSIPVAEKLASQHNAKVSYTSFYPSIDIKKNINTIKHTVTSTKIVDLTKGINIKRGALSEPLTEAILKDDTGKVLLFAGRLGYAPYIACRSCQKVVQCPNCNVSLVFHKNETKLICHHCTHTQERPRLCPYCKSPALQLGGVGIEKVTERITKELEFRKKYEKLENYTLLQLDSETIKTSTQADKIINKFNTSSSQKTILVATQMVLGYKNSIQPDVVGVIDADTLTKIPDFRSQERLFRQLSILRSMTQKDFIVQTRTTENPVLNALKNKSEKEFISEERTFREMFDYPPFASLITIVHRNISPRTAQQATKALYTHLLKTYAATLPENSFTLTEPYPAWITKENNLFKWHITLKIKNKNITPKITEPLSRLSSHWQIYVHPKTIV